MVNVVIIVRANLLLARLLEDFKVVNFSSLGGKLTTTDLLYLSWKTTQNVFGREYRSVNPPRSINSVFIVEFVHGYLPR